jgi:hypothetical protein
MCFKEGFRRSIPYDAIPGLRDVYGHVQTKLPRSTPKHLRYSEELNDPEVLAMQFNNVLQLVKNHKCAWPFLKPVLRSEVPDYYDHIKYPMDLKTMGERLKARYQYELLIDLFIKNKYFLDITSHVCSSRRICAEFSQTASVIILQKPNISNARRKLKFILIIR